MIPTPKASQRSLAGKQFFSRLTANPLFQPLFLLVLCFLAYGVLIPWLGFYADDWIMLWIYQKLGAWGVDYYHITNRPFLAPLYQVLLPLLGAEPWRWQLFAVLAPWLTSLSGWFLIRSLWPGRIRFAVFASILIAVFPGYLSHGVALTTGHRNIILAIFLLSLLFTVLALRRSNQFWLFYLLALLTSVYNMLAMEYFLLMELMRPFVIWIVLSETNLTVKQKLRKTALHFLPFFLAMCAVLYWRAFLFPYQTFSHSLGLLSQIQEDFFSGILVLAKQTLLYLWMAMVRAWTQIVTVIYERVEWGSPTSLAYALLALTTAAVTFLVLRAYRVPQEPAEEKKKTLAIQLLGLSIVPWLAGGIPFILVGLEAGVGGYETRYLLPYLLVSCLWVAFLITSVFKSYRTQILILSVVVGLSAGLQFISSNGLRAIDARRRNFFWNISYRIPRLEPGTMIVTNDMRTGDGASAWTYIFNWLYQPDLSDNDFPYLIVFGSQVEDLQSRSTGDMGLIATHFKVDPSKVVFLNYNGKNCPQLYNPEFPAEFPEMESRAARWLEFASLEPISMEGAGQGIDPSAIHLGSEPERGWCYYYEKADLARQGDDWQTIREIGNEAIYQIGLQPGADTELIPFILAYALGGEWEKAFELLLQVVDLQIARDQGLNIPLLQNTRDYVDRNTPASSGKTAFMMRINQMIEKR